MNRFLATIQLVKSCNKNIKISNFLAMTIKVEHTEFINCISIEFKFVLFH